MGTLGLLAGIAGILGLVIGGGLKQVDLKKGSAEGGGTPSKVLMGTGGALLVVGVVLVVFSMHTSATAPAAAASTSTDSGVSRTIDSGSPLTTTVRTEPSLGPASVSPEIVWGPRTLTFASPGQTCQLVRADMDGPIVGGADMDHHDLEWAPWCDDGGLQLDLSGKGLNRSSQRSDPDPVTCEQDAQSGSLPDTYGGDLHVGDTFCLLSGGGHVVWLQLTGKTGDTQGPSLTFKAIAWNAP